MNDSIHQDPVIARQIPRPDFSIDQCWDEYTQDQHAIWDTLYARQLTILAERAAPEFLAGLKRLELSRSGIPDLKRLLRALNLGTLKNLARLYWYTVEFGLINSPNGLRIYGAGIVSSAGESRYALENESPNRIGFELERVMRTDYEIDEYQKSYFVIDNYKQLFDATQQDFGPIYERLKSHQHSYGSDQLLPEDQILLAK